MESEVESFSTFTRQPFVLRKDPFALRKGPVCPDASKGLERWDKGFDTP